MKIVKPLIFWFVTLLAAPTNAQIFDVPYKNDAPTGALMVGAKDPKAVVLLFIGGSEWLKLKEDGSTANTHTFTRSMDLWAQYGINAVLVDSPYSLGGARNDVRLGKDHQQRIVNDGGGQAKLVSGVIIAGTVDTVSIDSSFQSPVLAIHHQQDECRISPLLCV